MSQHARTHTWQNRTYGLNILFTPVHYPCVFLVPSGWQSHKHTLNTWTLVSQVPQLLTEHSKPPGSRSWHILFWVGDSPGPWDAEGRVRRVCPSPLQLSPSGAQQEGARWQLGDIPGPVSPGWHSCRAASSFPGWMHSQPFHPPWASLILYQQPLGTSDCVPVRQAGDETCWTCAVPPAFLETPSSRDRAIWSAAVKAACLSLLPHSSPQLDLFADCQEGE